MKTADYRWNEKVESFNCKLNKLKGDINEYKKQTTQVQVFNNKVVYLPKVRNDLKKKEISTKNEETNNVLNKRTNVGCALKINNNNNSTINNNQTMKFNFPLTKEPSNKIITTHNQESSEYKISSNLILRNKRKTEKIPTVNEQKCTIPTKNIKDDKINNNTNVQISDKKKVRTNKFLYLEGEEGNLHVYPVYADVEVGFQCITQMEDDNLSKVNKDNQDDDDIKTTKHLAQWSSELVQKYLKETIEKSKEIFNSPDMKWREAELLRRMQE